MKITVLFILNIFLLSCFMDESNPELIGTWQSGVIDSPDLGSITCVMIFKDNERFVMHIELDTNDVLSFSGVFTLNDNLLSLHSTLGFGIEDGKKVHGEKMDIFQNYRIENINTKELVLEYLDDSVVSDLKTMYLKKVDSEIFQTERGTLNGNAQDKEN